MIKFPSVHIATSVQNRILNVRDELEGHGAQPKQPPAPVPPPVLPDTELPGAIIDAKVNEPPPANVPPLETQEPPTDELAARIARGDNLISA